MQKHITGMRGPMETRAVGINGRQSAQLTVNYSSSTFLPFFPNCPRLRRGTPRAPAPATLSPVCLPFQDASFSPFKRRRGTALHVPSSSSSPGLLSRDRSDASSVSQRDLNNSPERNSAADQARYSRSPTSLFVRRALTPAADSSCH
jgi:hypothetical protein